MHLWLRGRFKAILETSISEKTLEQYERNGTACMLPVQAPGTPQWKHRGQFINFLCLSGGVRCWFAAKHGAEAVRDYNNAAKRGDDAFASADAGT